MTLPSTAYAPSPGTTDSEYNELRKENERLSGRVRVLTNALEAAWGVADRLGEKVEQLTSEKTSLAVHIQADHAFLRDTLGTAGLVTAHNPHAQSSIRTRLAADDGPEAVYDWSEDEDSALYQEPFERLPNTGGYNFPQTHDLPEGSPGIRAVDSPDTTTEEP